MNEEVLAMTDYHPLLELSDRVYLIRGKNDARFPEANCLFIDDEIPTLVDAGASFHSIKTSLEALGHTLHDIDRIVLTHFHIDHKGYAMKIQEESQCEIICHPLSIQGVETFDGMVDYYGIDMHDHFKDWKEYLHMMMPHVTGSYSVTGTFDSSKEISCGETSLIPIHTPGHTIDHTCFGINGFDLMFLVDIDLTRFGPWYGNRVSDIDDFRESIRKIIDLTPKVAISSHLIEPVRENLSDRLEHYLRVFDLRDEKIVSLIEKGHDSIEKLAAIPTIYPRIPRDLFLVFEEFMLRKHIESLASKGIVSVEDGNISLGV